MGFVATLVAYTAVAVAFAAATLYASRRVGAATRDRSPEQP